MRRLGTIRIIVTGGTIDKEYDKFKGELVFTGTHIDEILSQARCTKDYELETLMLKDSLFMSEEDREDILTRCLDCDEEMVIVTHGTDTMPETARLIAKRLAEANDGKMTKTIALVGAMIPYSFVKSDAAFNLGCAMLAVQSMPFGVYVTMNGKVFSHETVRKNKELGVFEG